MNIYEKINELRVCFLKESHRKTGKNTFAGFSYFELQDFIPQVVLDCQRIGIGIAFKVKVKIKKSMLIQKAVLTLNDCENPQEKVKFSAPFGSCQLKGCHEVQNIGASITYMRRYCWGMALELVENDAVDASEPLKQPSSNEQPQKSEEELKLESEKTDVYNAMKDVLNIEELRDVTLKIMDGKDKEKQKIFWNLALQVVRKKKWNESNFSKMCVEAKGKK